MTSHISAASGTTTTTYGDGVNPTQVTTSRSHAIHTSYDALNRLVTRTMPEVTYAKTQWCDPLWDGAIPPCPSQHSPDFPIFPNAPNSALRIVADTATFTYDAMGNLTTAVNRDASVRRSYYPNGALRTDSLTIFPYTVNPTSITPGPAAPYGNRVEYDLNGRRVKLFSPGGDSIRYGYDGTTGVLSDVWDARGDQYTYARDRRDRVDTLYYPNGVTESRVYDDDDRLTNRGGGLMALSLTVSYSQADQVVNASGGGENVEFLYQGLGGVLEAETYHPYEPGYVEEQFLMNEYNTVVWSYAPGDVSWKPDWIAYHLVGSANRTEAVAGGTECTWLPPYTCTEDYSTDERWTTTTTRAT